MDNWDISIITAIISGIILIIGAVVTGIVTVIKTVSETKDKVVDATKQISKVREINQNQMTQLKSIKILVDGRYSDVLNELARIKQLLADNTKLESDQDEANIAHTVAKEQEVRVSKSEEQESGKEKESG